MCWCKSPFVNESIIRSNLHNYLNYARFNNIIMSLCPLNELTSFCLLPVSSTHSAFSARTWHVLLAHLCVALWFPYLFIFSTLSCTKDTFWSTCMPHIHCRPKNKSKFVYNSSYAAQSSSKRICVRKILLFAFERCMSSYINKQRILNAYTNILTA